MRHDVAEQRRRNTLIVAGTLLGTILIYANTVRNGFINFDDPENVLENYSIRALNLANLQHFFTAPLQYMYTPLVSISYAIDYHFGHLGATAYHVTNLLLHLCNVVLVYHLCRALTRKAFIAHFAAIAFAIHPANVDTVSWISTRSTLLATLFSLATLLTYVKYARRHRWPLLVASVLLFVLAVLSKSTAVALVLTLPVLDYCRGRKMGWRPVLEKVPFALVALAGGLLTLHYRIDTSSLYAYTPLDRVFVVCSALVGYLIRLVFPYPLAFAYGYPAKHGALLPWYVYAAPIVLGLVVVLLFRTGMSRKLLVFGLSFFVLNILLSQTALLVDNYKSNRYAYLPYVGLFLIAGELVRRGVEKLKAMEERRAWLARLAPVWPAVLALYVAFFSVASFGRSMLWNEPIRVLDNSIAHESGVPFVYNSRGMTEYSTGNYRAALVDFERTIRLDPRFSLAYYYRGVIKTRDGDYSGALADFNTAIGLSSRFGAAYDERGKAKLQLKDYPGAVADLTQAIVWDGYFVDAYFNRGQAYTSLGNYPQAISDLDRVIALSPGYGEAYFHRGNARQHSGDVPGACADWRSSVAQGYQEATQTIQSTCPS